MRPYPFQLLRLPPGDNSFPSAADIQWHQQVKVGIEVARKRQRCEALLLDGDSQFLLQLADQTISGPFPSLDLAPRKLPEPRHRLAFRALGDKHASVGIDQGTGGDKHEFNAHGRASI